MTEASLLVGSHAGRLTGTPADQSVLSYKVTAAILKRTRCRIGSQCCSRNRARALSDHEACRTTRDRMFWIGWRRSKLRRLQLHRDQAKVMLTIRSCT